VFDSADVDRVGELDEYEVVRLMKKLNNSLATVKIQQKLKVHTPSTFKNIVTMHARIAWYVLSSCVCRSVTRWYCMKVAEHMMMQTLPQ